MRGKKAQKQAAELRAKKDSEDRATAAAQVGRKSNRNGAQPAQNQNQEQVKDEEATPTPSPDPMDLDSALPAAQDTTVLETNNDRTKVTHPEDTKSHLLNHGAAHTHPDDTADSQPQNYYEGKKSAKQLSESLTDFLARLPPSTTSIATAGGPWIRIANPHPKRHQRNHESGDIQSFRQLGLRVLEIYTVRKKEVEAANPDKAAGSITRMLRAERTQLEPAILDVARATGVTCGKWMLFPNPQDVDRLWAIVARGTWEGKLGVGAKVAVNEDDGGKQHGRLICVYTYDFADKVDVKRVLLGMKGLGLLDSSHSNNQDQQRTKYGGGGYGSKNNKGLITIYYKTDAFTYLDIANGNEFRLKASLYCSKDFLD